MRTDTSVCEICDRIRPHKKICESCQDKDKDKDKDRKEKINKKEKSLMRFERFWEFYCEISVCVYQNSLNSLKCPLFAP